MIMSDDRPGRWSAWTWPAVGLVLLLALPGFSWEKAKTPVTTVLTEERVDVADAASTSGASAKRANGAKLDDADVARMAKSVGASLAVIRVEPDNPQAPSQGLGVVLSKNGLILTCQRLLDSAGDITVRLANGKTYNTKQAATGAGPLALVKIEADPDELSPIGIGHPSALRVGSPVLAIGSSPEAEFVVGRGTVTATDRDVVIAPGVELKSLIQTDVSIGPYRSGGPLVDAHGLLVGISPLSPSELDRKKASGISFFASVVEIMEDRPDVVQLSGQSEPVPVADSLERDEDTAARETEIDGEVLDEILRRVEQHYFQKVDRQELLNAAIDGMLKRLDGNSAYLRQKELDEVFQNIDQSIVGVGIELRHEDGQLIVVRTLPSSPAAKAGVRDGDIIEQIDRLAVSDLAEKKRLAAVVGLIRGKPGEAVTLGVRRESTGLRETIRIVRSAIKLDTVQGHRRGPDSEWQYMLDGEDKIGYIRIKAFGKPTSKDVDEAVGKLRDRGMQGLVLDLRDCPGGLLTAAVETADLFVEEGAIVTIRSRTNDGEVYQHKADKQNTYIGFPMVVLVNGRTASAAEILAACLQDHKRATIAGERTFGRGVVSGIFSLESGAGAVRLATASFQRPNGKGMHRFADADESDDWGVMPDKGLGIRRSDLLNGWERAKTVRDADVDHRELEDVQLRKSLEHLREQLDRE